MGLIKGLLFFGGMPVRPSTTRERSRGYQRQANNLQAEANEFLEEQVRALETMNKRLMAAQGGANTGQNTRSNSPEAISPETMVEKLQKIGRLHELHKSGALTEAEFDSQKQSILKSI